MRRNLEPTMEHVFAWEGGYTDTLGDGPPCTNMGITLWTYQRYVDANAGCEDLKRMSKDTAMEIYRNEYWNRVRGDDLPPGVDLEVTDMAINAGPSRSARLLQKCVGAAQDGIVGPNTIAAAWAMDGEDLLACFYDARMAYYRSLRQWSKFGKGWTNRANGAKDAALRLHREQRGTLDEELEESLPPANREEEIGRALLTLIRLLREAT